MVKSAHKPIVAHQDGAYLAFYSMKRLGVFLLPPPGWDASLSQGYPPALKDLHAHCHCASLLRTKIYMPSHASSAGAKY